MAPFFRTRCIDAALLLTVIRYNTVHLLQNTASFVTEFACVGGEGNSTTVTIYLWDILAHHRPERTVQHVVSSPCQEVLAIGQRTPRIFQVCAI